MMHFKPDCTLSLFHDRLYEALPNASGLQEIVEPKIIDRILKHVLQDPLIFDNKTMPQDALWWFRGGSSYQIEGFQPLGGNQYLIQWAGIGDELIVDKITIYTNRAEMDLSFLYLNCKPLPPIFANKKNIESQLEWRSYAEEELGYIPDQDRYVDRAYADEGYIEIDGQDVDVPAVRIRNITPYNRFIAPKESRLNNTGGEISSALDRICDDLLKNSMTIEQFIPLIHKLPPSGFRRWLLGLAQ